MASYDSQTVQIVSDIEEQQPWPSVRRFYLNEPSVYVRTSSYFRESKGLDICLVSLSACVDHFRWKRRKEAEEVTDDDRDGHAETEVEIWTKAKEKRDERRK